MLIFILLLVLDNDTRVNLFYLLCHNKRVIPVYFTCTTSFSLISYNGVDQFARMKVNPGHLSYTIT